MDGQVGYAVLKDEWSPTQSTPRGFDSVMIAPRSGLTARRARHGPSCRIKAAVESAVVTLANAGNFLISPNLGLLIWTCMVGLTLLAGAATAAKGRWGWFFGGFLTGGSLWLFAAFLPAADTSLWSRVARRRWRDPV